MQFNKVYKFRNGCRITKEKTYDGIQTQEYWVLYLPNDEKRYGNFGSFEKARDYMNELFDNKGEDKEL